MALPTDRRSSATAAHASANLVLQYYAVVLATYMVHALSCFFHVFLDTAIAFPLARNPGMEIGVWVALGHFTQAIGLETSDASVYCAFLCSLTVVRAEVQKAVIPFCLL